MVDIVFDGSVTSAGVDLGASISWALSTDVFTAPVIAYASADVQVSTSGDIIVYVLSGSEPISSYGVTTGSLPTEFTLNASTGVISYINTTSTSSGSFGITATNPVGDSAEYTVNYEISEAHGIDEFTNSELPYPFMRVSTSNSVDTQILIKQTFHGTTTSTSNGTIIEDSTYPIYAGSNGDSTWNYMIFPAGYSYWLLFANSTTDPALLADTYASDLTTSGLSYDLVTPTSQDITLDGVDYPSDSSDVHWGTGQKYIDFGQPASLDDFMTSAGSWSYGFRLQSPWQKDGMGRVPLNRSGRNWNGIRLGHSATYSELLIGNGSSTTSDSSEDTTLPAAGFAVGDYVRYTFNGSILAFYVNGTSYYSYSLAYIYMDGVSANELDVRLGEAVDSNAYNANATYSHGGWQGAIDRLWISNGVVETTDDNGTTFPTGYTHSWLLDEATGNTFAADTGGVTGTGAGA